MIPARKHRLFTAWFARHAEGRIKARFGAVWVSGLASARAAAAEGTLVVVSNHVAWWDPLVALWLSDRVLGTRGHAMMDAKNLARLPFFGLAGAFGVDLGDRRDGAAAVRHARALLAEPGTLLWIFAQGRERPITARPLGFLPGSALVARLAGRPTIPVALRYEHAGAELPELFVAIGAPLAPQKDTREASRAEEAAVTALLDGIDAALQAGSREAFTLLHRARPGAVARLAEAILVWLTRPRLGAR